MYKSNVRLSVVNYTLNMSTDAAAKFADMVTWNIKDSFVFIYLYFVFVYDKKLAVQTVVKE